MRKMGFEPTRALRSQDPQSCMSAIPSLPRNLFYHSDNRKKSQFLNGCRIIDINDIAI